MNEKQPPSREEETPPNLPLSGEEKDVAPYPDKGGTGRGFLSPYPGLRPYREDEQDRFFGRDADRDILIDKMLTNRLTLLFAASGVGKSSLLQAAVMPQLKSAGGENLSVAYHIDWVGEPLAGVRGAIMASLQASGLLPDEVEAEGETLAEFIAFCGLFVRPPLVLILDQFEEFFRYQPHTDGHPFIRQLTQVILDKDLPVSVVISMREDFAMELNVFKPGLPTLLFENYYRLEKLTREAAQRAIVEPVEQAGWRYAPELLDRLLRDLQDHQRAEVTLPHMTQAAGAGRIDPPYLQIVCARLWDLRSDDAGKVLQPAAYEQAGGVNGILRHFLDHALARLTPREKQLASRAFDYLAAQRGVKMAYPVDLLAKTLRVREAKLATVLEKLSDVPVAAGQAPPRILRSQQRDKVMWYELYHDMFAPGIERWNNAWKEKRLRRQRWWLGSVVVFFTALLVLLVDSFLWMSRNNFPAEYLFHEQKFRLMSLGLLPKPLPEMVEIPASDNEFQSGELDKRFGEMANQSLQDQGTYNLQNFGYPPIAASISTPFAIGKHEVTYEQYDYYVWRQHRSGDADAGEAMPIYPTGSTRDNGRGQRAVTQVSWNEAVAYTQWLSEETGEKYRLPTEVEWEYAARAGTETPYWWGDEAEGLNKANCAGCGSQWDNLLVAPVGSFEANPWGLQDTAGNVWEWTCSEWQPGLGDAAKQCAGESTSSRRVIRGGSWNLITVWVRSSARSRNFTDYRYNDVGFRILRVSRQDK